MSFADLRFISRLDRHQDRHREGASGSAASCSSQTRSAATAAEYLGGSDPSKPNRVFRSTRRDVLACKTVTPTRLAVIPEHDVVVRELAAHRLMWAQRSSVRGIGTLAREIAIKVTGDHLCR